MFKKSIALVLVVMMVSLAFVGCTGTETAAADEVKVAMVTDVGGVNDLSFNQSAWEGLQQAQDELGVVAGYIESKQEADYETNLETLMDQENDLVWGIGFMMADAVSTAATNNPDQSYAIIDSTYEEIPANVVCATFKEHEPSFLVGYIAGKMTESNKVGFIGGMEFPVIFKFEYGFKAGVKHANPEVEVLSQYAGSFTDAAAGKSIAEQMYNDGADVIFHAAGGVGAGMIEAAKEKGFWAIGVDRDQNDLAPEQVLTSAMKRVDQAIFLVSKDKAEGNFKGGTNIEFGLKEGGVGIAPSSDKNVPAEILAEVEQLTKDIIDGTIVVPQTEEEFMK